MKHYVSNKKETPRMFDSAFLEFFSRVHWTVPLWIFLPLNALLILKAYRLGMRFESVLGYFLAGVATWTLTEYLLHRFVFHYHPRSDWGKKIHWTFHGVHHDYPSDPLRLVMVPAVSLPLAFLFTLLFSLPLGFPPVLAFMSGFLTGYLFYDITHYAVHHFPIKGAIFGRLREHHLRHHFQDPDHGFGVSSPLWDAVFRTSFEVRARQAPRTFR